MPSLSLIESFETYPRLLAYLKTEYGSQLNIESVTGGRNHQGYRITNGIASCFVKLFYRDGLNLRFQRERAFYTMAKAKKVQHVPDFLSFDEQESWLCLSYIDGKPITQATSQAVESAIEFIVQLNHSLTSEDVEALPLAADACLNEAEHIHLAEKRINRLLAEPTLPDAVRRFVKDTLAVRLSLLKSELGEISPSSKGWGFLNTRIASPSDFGFHNALYNTEENCWVFYDFEHAGKDSLGKFLCDFLNQPQIPVPLEYVESSITRLCKGFRLPSPDLSLVKCLLALHRIKWSCILLNEYLTESIGHRLYSLKKSETDIGELQLNNYHKSKAYFEQYRPT